MGIMGRIIRNFGILLAMSLWFNGLAIAADVSLAWDPSPSDDVSGYRLHIGSSSRTYSSHIAVGNQTTYKVTSLTSGTWFFTVTAFDSAGNESDYSNEVSQTITAPNTGGDSTPPVITGVTSSSIIGTSATIAWITNEASDTQVEYGTSAAYGSATALRSSLVTLHSETLTGLAENTLYHYRVKSRDAAGNLAASADYFFTTVAIGDAPQISAIEVTDITDRSAVITWETNVPSDSQVEYWENGGPILTSALGSYRTSHSIRLNNLKKQRQYSFRITAKNPDDLQSESPTLSFTTLALGVWTAAVPRFADSQVDVKPGDEVAIGIALTNSDFGYADITYSALDGDGTLMSGQDIVNPRLFQLNPQKQHAMLDVEIFGFGLEPYGTKGWIKLESSAPGVDGFFLAFDNKLSFMDGTDLGYSQMTDLIFTEIEPDGSTKIDVINSNNEAADVVFDLMTADGSVRSSQSRTIAGNGALVADLYEDLFEDFEPEAGDYVRVNSTMGVQAFQLLQRQQGDVSYLAGQDMSEGGSTLYSPQYVLDRNTRTTLSIVNLDPRPGTVEFRCLAEDGLQIGDTRELQIPANGKIYINDPDFFGPHDPNRIYSGYVKIASAGIRMAGSTIFGHSDGKSYTAALPLIYRLQDSVIFSHVASDDRMYTGVAIANPGTAAASAAIQLYSADGAMIEQRQITIPAGQRMTRVLTEIFPSLMERDQLNGHIRIIADTPLASFALFGTTDLKVLSAIPPKIIQ